MCNIVSNVTGPLRESLVVETEDEIKCDVCWAQLQTTMVVNLTVKCYNYFPLTLECNILGTRSSVLKINIF